MPYSLLRVGASLRFHIFMHLRLPHPPIYRHIPMTCRKCRRCAAPPVPGKYFCETHIRINKQEAKARTEARRKAGLCYQCKGVRDPDGPRLCEPCRVKGKEERDKARNEGLCTSCKKVPPSAGYRLCDGCREKGRTTARRIHDSRAAKGGCVLCEGPVSRGSRHCSGCLAARREETVRLRAEGLCIGCRNGMPANKKSYCDPCLVKFRPRANVANAELKREVLTKYGGIRCVCCGETHLSLLTLDHVDGGGNKHRREIGGNHTSGGGKMYRWLKANGYPPGYQTMCFTCNYGKYACGTCPCAASAARQDVINKIKNIPLTY